MSIRFGASQIAAVRYGEAEVSAMYLGATQVYAKAAPAGPTYDQWRILIRRIASSTDWLTATEIEFRGALGGPNLAVGGTAIASAVNPGDGAAAYAFDGNLSTRWGSGNTSKPGWIGYQFPSPVSVQEVMIRPSGTGAGPVDFDVQYWNGTEWVTAWAFVDIWWDSVKSRTFPMKPKCIWRLKVVKQQGSGSWTAVRGLMLRDTAAGPSLPLTDAKGGPVVGGGASGQSVMNAFDSDTTSQWSAQTSAVPVSLGWAFSTPTDLKEFAIIPPGNLNDSPTQFLLEYWNGNAWVAATPIYTTTWQNGVAQSFEVPAAGTFWKRVRSRALTTVSGGWGGYTLRQKVLGAGLDDVAGNKIRIALTAGGDGLNIAAVRLGVGANEDLANLDYGEPPVQLTWDGSPTAFIAANQTKFSDPIPLSVDGTKSLIVSIYSPDGLPASYLYAGASNTAVGYVRADITAAMTPSGLAMAGKAQDILAFIEVM